MNVPESINSEFNRIDKVIERETSERSRIEADFEKCRPTFFERILMVKKIPYPIGCLLVGSVFLLAHLLLALHYRADIWEDRSCFLGPMISLYLFCGISVTLRFREFMSNFFSLVKIDFADYKSHLFPKIVDDLSDRHFICYGIAVGALSALLGLMYGHWYPALPLSISLAVQHFAMGFIAGVGIGGILTLIKFIRHVEDNYEMHLDYFSPDSCAGTFVIGKLVFYMSFFSLIMGVAIPYYVLFSPWTNRGIPYIDIPIKVFVSLPFVYSLVVFIYPVLNLHAKLVQYKKREHLRIRNRLSVLAQKIYTLDFSSQNTDGVPKIIIECYNKLEDIEKTLLRMNTWPYPLKYRSTYLLAFTSSPFLSILANAIKKIF